MARRTFSDGLSLAEHLKEQKKDPGFLREWKRIQDEKRDLAQTAKRQLKAGLSLGEVLYLVKHGSWDDDE